MVKEDAKEEERLAELYVSVHGGFWQMYGFGGGKCSNLGVANVRTLGVVNVLLANDSQSI